MAFFHLLLVAAGMHAPVLLLTKHKDPKQQCGVARPGPIILVEEYGRL